MSYLIDTNILLRIVDPDHLMYSLAVNAIDHLFSENEQLYIMPQNLIEFWNVYTRPKEKNGLGGTIAEAKTEIDYLKSIFILLPDQEKIYSQWENLVTTYQVKGVNVHDAKLVASMLVHNITHILTFNIDDFKRYDHIISVHPQTFLN
jgi:predicted nucleic acid-binding protein